MDTTHSLLRDLDDTNRRIKILSDQLKELVTKKKTVSQKILGCEALHEALTGSGVECTGTVYTKTAEAPRFSYELIATTAPAHLIDIEEVEV